MDPELLDVGAEARDVDLYVIVNAFFFFLL